MTRLEKIQLCIEKGITCDVDTGKVYGVRGNELISKQKGYKVILIKDSNKIYTLFQHQFIFYVANGEIVNEIDHINLDKLDNRIINLRSVTKKQNQHNRTSKGYSWNKRDKKWISQIGLDNKLIYLGSFNTEIEAHKAYLDAKKIYHII